MKQIFVLAFFASFLLISCHHLNKERIRGNGTVKSETRSTGSFNSVDVGGAIDVFIKQDTVRSVRIETDENLLQYVKVEINGETLNIYPEDGFNLRSTGNIKVYVSGPSFNHLEASGASNIYGDSKITSDTKITIHVSGASDMKVELKAPSVEAKATGASNIHLKGETKDFFADGAGASGVNCFGLMTENARVEVSGASKAEVFASVRLEAHASGASHIKYKGNATVNKDVSGAGSVEKAD